MKTVSLLTALLFSLPALSHAESENSYTPEARSTSEIFTSKVVKLYTFQDSDAEYISYVLMWKDHEVVVTPNTFGAEKRYNVGDVVRCQMQQRPHRIGDSNKSRMTFTIIPTGIEGASMADEVQRLDAVRAEVEARRAKRTIEAAPLPKNP